MTRKTTAQIGAKAVKTIKKILNQDLSNMIIQFTNYGTDITQTRFEKLKHIEFEVVKFKSAKSFELGLYFKELDKIFLNYRVFETSEYASSYSETQRNCIKRMFDTARYFEQIASADTTRNAKHAISRIRDMGNIGYYWQVWQGVTNTDEYSNELTRDHFNTMYMNLRDFGKRCLFSDKVLQGRCSLVADEFYPKEGKKLCGNCGKEVDTSVGAFCEDCLVDIHKVRNYSAKPSEFSHLQSFQKNKADNDLLFFGVELEIDRRGSHEDLVRGIFKDAPNDFFFFKSDSSLRSGTGVETVTVPASFQKHKVAWRQFFKNNKNKELFTSAPSDSYNYGLHVHISRTGFSTMNHLINFVEFFSSECNFDYISEQSGRDIRNTGYCQSRVLSREELIQGRLFDGSGGRSTAINLTNPVTIEVRCCKSTDDYDEFMQRLEFIHNVFRYTRNVKAGDNTADKLKAWLAK